MSIARMSSRSGFVGAWIASVLIALPLSLLAQNSGESPASELNRPKDKVYDIRTFEEDARKERTDAGGPSLKNEMRLRQLEKRSEDMLNASIDTLKELIAQAPDEDPDKPDYYMNLADAYWEKSETFFEKAYSDDLEQKIFEAEEAGNTAAASTFKAEQEQHLADQQAWRQRTVDTYRVVSAKFPDTPKIDEVLYYQGLHQTLIGDFQGGYDTYVTLVKRKPDSQYVPDALVNIGEYYFNLNQFDTALQFYDKVIQGYPVSNVFGFAMYKSGWCYFNMGDYDLSLNAFLETIRYSDSDRASNLASRFELKKEAQKDMVRAYSMTGNPERAIPFFKKLAPDIYLDLASALADMYSSQDKFADANKLYRFLIKERAETHYVLEYQRKIVSLVYRSQNKTETVKEVQRMLGLYQAVGPRAPADWLKRERTEVEREMRVIATTWHKEGQKPFNPDTLQQAANLYREYRRLFPESPYVYDVAMNQAILLKDVKNFPEAAEAFDSVVIMDAKGKYAKEAAYFAMFSYYQLLNLREGEVKSEEEEGLDPQPIPDIDKRMAEACKRYVDVAGADAESAAEANYAAGRIYYNYNHFDDAIPLLETVVTKYESNPSSPEAARLLLSSYNLKHDFKNLEKWAKALQGTSLASGNLAAIITKINDQADFNRCFEYEVNKDYGRAGDCFMRYAETYPNAELLDKAIFNAAVNYNRAKLVEKALQAHGDLYNRRQDSPLAPKSLFAIAEIYRQLAIYSDAATYYEQFAENHKGHSLVEKALRYASVYRKALGEYDRAIANYGRYLDQFPDTQQAPTIFFDAGLIYETQEDWRAVDKHFSKFLRTYGSDSRTTDDLVLGANLKLGLAAWNRKKTKNAVRQFEKVLALYRGLAPERRGKLTKGIGFIAEAQFMLGEKILRDAGKIKITSRNLEKAFQKKLATIGEARGVFVEVIKLQQPSWVIAGLNRVGLAYEELGSTIENAPAPRGLNEEQKELYRESLYDKAQSLKGKAVEAYRECLDTARELQWYNDYSEQASTSLSKLDYSFDFIKEYRARPTHYSLNETAPGFTGQRGAAKESNTSAQAEPPKQPEPKTKPEPTNGPEPKTDEGTNGTDAGEAKP